MEDNEKKKFGTVGWMRRVLSTYRWSILNLMLLQTGVAFIITLYPMMTLRVLNGIERRNMMEFQRTILYFSLFFLVQLLLGWMTRIYTEKVRLSIEIFLKQRFLKGWLSKENLSVHKFHSGDLMTRITADIQTVTEGVISVIPHLLSVAVRIFITIVFMHLLIPKLSYLMVAGGILLFSGSLIVKKGMKRLHKKTSEADARFRSFLQEAFQNPVLIQSFAMENYVIEKSQSLLDSYKKEALRRNQFQSLNQFVIGFAFSFAILTGATLSGIGIIRGEFSLGTYIAVAQLIGQLMGPLTGLANFIAKYFSMTASMERLQEVNPRQEEAGFEKREEGSVPSRIRFSEVSFGYKKGKEILSQFCFQLEKGRHIGIIGHSGVGKSTFLKLLIGVYQEDSGTVWLEYEDEVEERKKENLPRYRRLFAYVPQGNGFMSGTIRESITLGRGNQEKKIWESLHLACAAEFVEGLEKGLDALLEEAGKSLSEGQLQRLSIARALYADRPFLVLDEATSALDIETEKRVLQNLSQQKDRTMVIVTHRRKALEVCDEILNLDRKKEEKGYEE